MRSIYSIDLCFIVPSNVSFFFRLLCVVSFPEQYMKSCFAISSSSAQLACYLKLIPFLKRDPMCDSW